MTGAIMQIMKYGSEDIYLTGTPQVTFFKIVYRRHTQFAIQGFYQDFDTTLDFGGESQITLTKNGDLISQVYLTFDLPRISLANRATDVISSGSVSDFNKQAVELETYRKMLTEYVQSNFRVAKQIVTLLETSFVGLNRIVAAWSDPKVIESLERAEKTLGTYLLRGSLHNVASFSDVRFSDYFADIKRLNVLEHLRAIWNRSLGSSELSIRESLTKFLRSEYYRMVEVFIDDLNMRVRRMKQIIADAKKDFYSFAWTNNFGTSLLEMGNIVFGSEVVDVQTGDFVHLYEQLYLSPKKAAIFNEMIGNVERLKRYDSTPKEQASIIIPIPFWFTRNYSSALPIVALEHTMPVINVKLRPLVDVCRFDEKLSLDEFMSNYDIKMGNVKLLVEYVFLGNDEKNRFAKSSHEYLIEVVQYAEQENIYGRGTRIHLDFTGPIKYLAWFAQPMSIRTNDTGHNATDYGGGYLPTIKSTIKINSYKRADYSSAYYNLLQPHEYFSKSVQPNLNVFSFGLFPTSSQPSGTLNGSRISDLKLSVVFTQKLQYPVYFAVYAVTYTILRFCSGYAATAFGR